MPPRVLASGSLGLFSPSDEGLKVEKSVFDIFFWSLIDLIVLTDLHSLNP